MRGVEMTYFYHNKCRSLVYLDLNDMLKIIASFGIGKTALKVGQAVICPVSTVEKTKFYCHTCGNIDVSEVFARCFSCGNSFSLEELYTLSKSGGIYCQECSNLPAFCEEDKKLILNIIKTVKI